MTLVTKIEVRYCEDCRFFRARGNGSRPLCSHPEATIDNVVSRQNASAFCESTRIGVCGREAKLFEPKPIVEKVRQPVQRESWFSMFRRRANNG